MIGLLLDPVAAAMKHLESQHQKDKEGALAQQREQYEQELEHLRKQILPQQQLFSNMSYSEKVESSEAYKQEDEEDGYKKWANERLVIRILVLRKRCGCVILLQYLWICNYSSWLLHYLCRILQCL